MREIDNLPGSYSCQHLNLFLDKLKSLAKTRSLPEIEMLLEATNYAMLYRLHLLKLWINLCPDLILR